jgi:hypothetical protein
MYCFTMLPAQASILRRTHSANPMAEAKGLRAEDFTQCHDSDPCDCVNGVTTTLERLLRERNAIKVRLCAETHLYRLTIPRRFYRDFHVRRWTVDPTLCSHVGYFRVPGVCARR